MMKAAMIGFGLLALAGCAKQATLARAELAGTWWQP